MEPGERHWEAERRALGHPPACASGPSFTVRRGLRTCVPGFRDGTRSLIILASETVTPPATKRIRRGWSLG